MLLKPKQAPLTKPLQYFLQQDSQANLKDGGTTISLLNKKLEILKLVELDEDQEQILNENGRPIQNAIATFILALTFHFVRDPSHLKDKNAELLYNLICKKLNDFKWYKDTFLTRVILQEDSNKPF